MLVSKPRGWRSRRQARAAYAAQAAEIVREHQRAELARAAALAAENADLRRKLAEARDHARWLAERVKALEGRSAPRDSSGVLKS